MEYGIAYSLATAIFVGGMAWGATKSALNGTRQRVQEIHETVIKHITDEHNADQKTHERIASVEAKVDLILARIK